MAGKPKYSRKQVANLLIQNFGNKTVVAERLGTSWNTIDAYCRKYPTCRDAVEIARNRWVDMAENRLAKKVEAGDNWAIGMVLKSLGKERGWGDSVKQEHDGEIKITWLNGPENP